MSISKWLSICLSGQIAFSSCSRFVTGARQLQWAHLGTMEGLGRVHARCKDTDIISNVAQSLYEVCESNFHAGDVRERARLHKDSNFSRSASRQACSESEIRSLASDLTGRKPAALGNVKLRPAVGVAWGCRIYCSRALGRDSGPEIHARSVPHPAWYLVSPRLSSVMRGKQARHERSADYSRLRHKNPGKETALASLTFYSSRISRAGDLSMSKHPQEDLHVMWLVTHGNFQPKRLSFRSAWRSSRIADTQVIVPD